MSALSSWKARLASRRRRARSLRAEYLRTHSKRVKKEYLRYKALVAQAVRGVRRAQALNQTVAFDGTPVFRGLALMLQDAREHGWSGRLNSADRRKGVAERYGKRSQWWLYMAYWVWHLRGANPANRPGQSTHELRSDGVAYRGPVGRPLAWWQLGMDVSESEELLAVLNRLGYKARRPYPSGSEAHHINLTTSPEKNLKRRHRL